MSDFSDLPGHSYLIGREAVAVARGVAFTAHYGQLDKAGKRYADHPGRVAARMQTFSGQQAAWLHDVLEDTDLTMRDLEILGFQPPIIGAVAAVSHRKGERRSTYLGRIVIEGALAIDVKLADMADNSDEERLLAIPDVETRDRLREKYAAGIKILTEARAQHFADVSPL